MSKQVLRADRWKLFLSVFWFVFTFSMVSWWWIFSLRQLDVLAQELTSEKYTRLRQMLLWEGAVLLVFIFCGGLALLILTNRERQRNLRLRLFFSNFSHDLKTSLNRLRLRAETIDPERSNQKISNLLSEVTRLDLQLENSLWIARGDNQNLLMERFTLDDVIGTLRMDWPEVEISMNQSAELKGDKQAFLSVVRNVLQNAWIHGSATKVDIKVAGAGSDRVLIQISDNGKGFTGERNSLGRYFVTSSNKQGNGIGLYLTTLLLERMNGRITFPQSANGFVVAIDVVGHVRGAL